MLAPYPEMNGANIRVVSTDGTRIGEIVAQEDKSKKKFGLRIDVQGTLTNYPHKVPIPIGEWVQTGAITITVFKLTCEQIKQIRKVDTAEAAFELTL